MSANTSAAEGILAGNVSGNTSVAEGTLERNMSGNISAPEGTLERNVFGNTSVAERILARNVFGNTSAAEGTRNMIINKNNGNNNNNNNMAKEGEKGPESYTRVFVSVSVSHKFHKTQIIATIPATERGMHFSLCKQKNQSAIQFILTEVGDLKHSRVTDDPADLFLNIQRERWPTSETFRKNAHSLLNLFQTNLRSVIV